MRDFISSASDVIQHPVPPLMPGEWSWLPRDQGRVAAAAAAKTVQAQHPGLPLPLEPDDRTLVRMLPLSCYRNAWLTEVCQFASEASPRHEVWAFFCDADDNVQLVTGNSQWIHALNLGGIPTAHALDIAIRRKTGAKRFDLAADYLRFFCGAVWGEAGPFRIVEDLQDPALIGAASVDGAWKEGIKPVFCAPLSDRDAVLAKAAVLYGGHLFQAVFVIEASGNITMRDDVSLAETLCPPYDLSRRPLRSLAVGKE